MLCSISTSKSSSNWLDRLRSSKGFPASNDLDLEHFLNPKSNPSIPSETKDFDAGSDTNNLRSNYEITPLDGKAVGDRKKILVDSGVQGNRGKEDWFHLMSNVLEELFNMGDSSEIQRCRGFNEKRNSRKQSNPKICVSSASASADGSCMDGLRKVGGEIPALSPSSADNSVTEVKGTEVRLKLKKQAFQDLERMSPADHSTYSRTELTIIDTSCPTWKSEKLLSRKGKIWKVRDKKRKSTNLTVCRKKRKPSQSDEDVGGKKKRKNFLLLSSSFKEAGREELIISSNRGCTQNDKIKPKELSDKHNQTHKRRQGLLVSFSRSPRKPSNRYTRVFHVPGVPTSSKNGVYLPKNGLKDN